MVMRRLPQVLFLALFIVLILTGKVQLWIALFGLSIIAAFFAGRIYCGWICPINTVMKGVSWLKKKLGVRSFATPAWLKRDAVRYTALGVFLALFVFTMISGKRLPVLPALLVLGVFLTIFFEEALWHRYLCPYGTILKWPATLSRRAVIIDPKTCKNHGDCYRVCPAAAVSKEQTVHVIDKSECLVCMTCVMHCSERAIAYRKVEN